MRRLILLPFVALGLLGAGPVQAQVMPGGQKVPCRWGEPQKMDAIPGCGIPRRLTVTAPGGSERLMFAKDDNPTLKRYFYRSRAIGAQAKMFKRMVNVARTDLVLCPSDFQKARILAFRVVKGRVITARPTCELGPPGAAMTPTMAAGAMTPPTMGPAAMAGTMTPATPAMATMGPRTVANAIESSNPVSQRDLVKIRRAMKMDSLARLLGLLGLLLGLGATVGVLVLALTLRRRVQRLERELDRSRADDA